MFASISACSINDTQSSTDQVQKEDQYDKVTVKQQDDGQRFLGAMGSQTPSAILARAS
jgi:hypothetical protein